jgi:hypothetical protein
LLSSVFQLVVLIHVIKLNINIKIVKSVKFHVISGVVSYKSGLVYNNNNNNDDDNINPNILYIRPLS